MDNFGNTTPQPNLIPRGGHRYARANGGFLWHLVPLGLNTAICGHTPTNKPGIKTKRAYWISNPDGTCPGRTCEKCLSK